MLTHTATPATHVSTKRASDPHLRHTRQALWGLWLVTVGIVVLLAYSVTPSSLGYGTHLKLGLPPCGFLTVFGVPCPSCGLTTSFAHMVRLQWLGAWHANPWGVLLFIVTLSSVPIALKGLANASPVLETLHRFHTEKIALFLVIFGITAWLKRLYFLWIG